MGKFTLVLVASILLVSILTISDSLASKPDNTPPKSDVFLVKSHSLDIKKQFPVRHNFDVGFTAHLNSEQLKKLESKGIEVELVPILQISKPPGGCDPWPKCKKLQGSPSGESTRKSLPSNQITWGMNKVYNDENLVATSGGANVDVAVLDTGVDRTHPDLQNRIEQCVDFSQWSPKVSTKIREGRCNDDHGHGTHVTGTIAADGGNDQKGIFGVAPDADIYSYKVCNSAGWCYSDDIAVAIDYAGNNGAEIVSMSFGSNFQSSLIRDAISRNSNVLFIAAAGNDGPFLGSMNFPGANPNVIGVGAIDENNAVPSWSSRGVNDGDGIIEISEVEFGAPGVGVESTWNDGAYKTISGTSMATPHISGLAAKLWQGSAADTRAFLQQSAPNLTEGDPAIGFGLPTVS